MSMSRKQYRDIADVIKDAWEEIENYPESDQAGARITVRNITNGLAIVFEIDNPRFDRQRFQLACTKSLEVTE